MKLVRLIISVTCSTGSLLSYGVTDLYPEQPKILSLITLMPVVDVVNARSGIPGGTFI